jgi:hypothetical protein
VRVTRILVGATLLVLLLVAVPSAGAQPGGTAADDERERTFVEALRRGGPVLAERYLALRDAREQAIAHLRRVEAQYAAAGSELRPIFLPQLRQARRAYAERSLGLLDFLDARDREALASHQDAIGQINTILEQRKTTRAELEKLRRAD